jgi:hypothetical protein
VEKFFNRYPGNLSGSKYTADFLRQSSIRPVRLALWCLLPVIAAAACTERISIETDDAPPRLVIYGYITTDTMQHSIRITRSAGYFTTDSPEGINNATVTVSDNDGKVIPLARNDTVAGLYQTAADVYGEEGKTYTLDVRLDFDGDHVPEHYQSSSYLTRINFIDSVGLQASAVFKNMVEVLLYAQDMPEENFYSIFVAINDVTVNSTINKFFIMDDKFINGQYINGVACYYLNQAPEDADAEVEILRAGDKVTLNINAIPKEYATFISNVRSEIRGSNPIFSGPPANVETNIRCVGSGVPVSGFFAAFPSRYADTVVKEEFRLKK